MLRLRKTKLLPQQVSDLGAFIFVCAMIPVTYLWEVILLFFHLLILPIPLLLLHLLLFHLLPITPLLLLREQTTW